MADILIDLQECEPVQLEPFIHQVGGHSSILCLDDRTVCKPLIKQELKFYETLPSCMKKFTPEYRGVVQVRFEEDEDGYLTVAAYPPKSFRYQASSKKHGKNRRFRVKNTGSIEIEIESDVNNIFVDEDSTGSTSSTGSGSTRPVKAPHNPWVLKCHGEHLTKLRNRGAGGSKGSAHIQKFTLLENLTRRFEYPCVLDLKMGTRQYGDDATPDKIESQNAKAASSTSGQLGVRICGLQVYQVLTGKFLCRNKYYGRKLGVDGFREGIYEFLNNGVRLRTDAIIPLIEKLRELKATLLTLDTFRFYTSSLLLIYEGLDPSMDVDDCESTVTLEKESRDYNSSDVLSMDTIDDNAVAMPIKSPETSKSVDDFQRAQFHEDPEVVQKNLIQGMSVSTDGLYNPATTSTPASNRSSRSNLAASRASTPSAASLSSESVDVRLIDFAHATHSGLDLGHCAKKHAGPDTGFILGVTNLIKILEEILEAEHP